MAAGKTYEPVATTTLSSKQNTVTFSNISQNYTDLVVVFNGSADDISNHFMQVGNGSIDTGSNYSTVVLSGDGSTPRSSRYTNDTVGFRPDFWANAAGKDKLTIFNLQNYSNTTIYKSCLMRCSLPVGGAQNAELLLTIGLWRSTSAINTLNIYASTNSGISFNIGSTFTIYGITAA